ncbi:putative piggyBac transposable element-derived protein 4-like [Penaeus vannamei]|uniref:Putative piggyBac transposable element-derived protein 4-like n=1 Tax=Penaeus vannamei TaxID=6689 RepID=A0A3R7QQ36_PENVA|nr:putative piggyBac transposable element-derived protein 4-like [Penaeus vannamei]
MSRQLSVRRSRRPRSSPAIRSLSFEEEEAVDDPRPSTSRGVPRLRDAPDPLLYTFRHSSDEECGDSEEEYTPPAKHRRTKDHSDPHFGDDSDWEGSDSEDESELSDCESEEDFVPLDDTSLDSDENLAEYVRRRRARTAPGISSFVWRKRGTSHGASTLPQLLGSRFLTWMLNPHLKRYVAQNPRTPSAHMKGWEDTTVKENQAERQADDRLWKLRPVVDVLDRQFREVFVPNKVVSIDESLWAFKGRHQALQFVPNKRARRGIKAGYTTAFRIYMGKDRGGGDRPAGERGPHGQGSVPPPTKKKNKRCRYGQKQQEADATDLQAKGGGSVDFRSTDSGMLALQWLDKRPVTMLSTVHTSEMVALPPNRQGIQRIKPKVVTDYNNGMKGVDFSDQLSGSYKSTRKTIKWYKKIFFNLLDMAVVNSLAVHRFLGGKMAQQEFKLELVRSLLKEEDRRGRRNRIARARFAPADPADPHMPEDTPLRRWRRCSQCWNRNKKRKETRVMCRTCGVSLCASPCFKEYHATLHAP